uniref:Uncharacterized protein n=1 Tax=Rangifer tarandus platyrhynchus TaxID=3082113 RepID=A0ACB0EV78_RANTA|nr:unnamed protein product [Rangifer tarandus platyrhynchus]
MARLGELRHGGKDGVQGTLLRLSSLGLIFTFPFPIDNSTPSSSDFSFPKFLFAFPPLLPKPPQIRAEPPRPRVTHSASPARTPPCPTYSSTPDYWLRARAPAGGENPLITTDLMRSEERCCLQRVRFLIIFSVTGESSNPGHRRATGAHEGRVFPSRTRRTSKGKPGLPLKKTEERPDCFH